MRIQGRSLAFFAAGAAAATTVWVLGALYLQRAAFGTGTPDPGHDWTWTVHRYADVHEAAGMLERFGVPDVVPATARNIEEWGDARTHDAWACLTVPDGHAPLRAGLEKAGARPVPIPSTPGDPPRPIWPAGTEVYALKESGDPVFAGLRPDTPTVCFFKPGRP